MQSLHWFRVRWDGKSLYKAYDLIGIRLFFLFCSRVPGISRCGQFNTGNASFATVWWAPRLATEGGRVVARAVQAAYFDLKEARFGWQNELMTTKKCEFSEGKTKESILLHNTGCMASVMGKSWGLVVQRSGIGKIRWVSPLLFWAPGAEQRRFWSPIRGGKAKTSQPLLDRTSVFH